MDALIAALPELLEFPLFKEYTRERLLHLCEGGQIIFASHREKLFSAGQTANYFGMVLSGAFKLSRPCPGGSDVIVHFSTPGDVIAAFIMAKKESAYPLSATSMGASRFLRIPRSTYIEFWKKEVELILRVQNLLSSRMHMLQDQKTMYRSPLPQKLAQLLLSLLERYPDNQSLVIPLPLTRKEIADTLGSAVESVIRIMSDWSKLGLIHTSDQQIEILRPDRIIEISQDLVT